VCACVNPHAQTFQLTSIFNTVFQKHSVLFIAFSLLSDLTVFCFLFSWISITGLRFSSVPSLFVCFFFHQFVSSVVYVRTYVRRQRAWKPAAAPFVPFSSSQSLCSSFHNGCLLPRTARCSRTKARRMQVHAKHGETFIFPPL